MTTLTVTSGTIDAQFKQNNHPNSWFSALGLNTDAFLNTQLGIFRLGKLASDAAEFLSETGLASGKWLVTVVAIGKASVTGTTLPHAITTIKPAAEQAETTYTDWNAEKFIKMVKNVSDVVSSWMFVFVTFAAKNSLVSPAKAFIFVGDMSELYLERQEWNKIKRANELGNMGQRIQYAIGLSNVNRITAAQQAGGNGDATDVPAYIDPNQQAAMERSLAQAQTLQMFKLAKVVASVIGGILFLAQFAPVVCGMVLGTAMCQSIAATVSLYVPGVVAALWTAETIALLNATCSLTSSVLAVSAYYYKESMDYHVKIS